MSYDFIKNGLEVLPVAPEGAPALIQDALLDLRNAILSGISGASTTAITTLQLQMATVQTQIVALTATSAAQAASIATMQSQIAALQAAVIALQKGPTYITTSDVVTLIDALSATITGTNYLQNFTDAVTTGESWNFYAYGAVPKTLTDSAAPVDGWAATKVAYGAWADSQTTAETWNKTEAAISSWADSVTLAENQVASSTGTTLKNGSWSDGPTTNETWVFGYVLASSWADAVKVGQGAYITPDEEEELLPANSMIEANFTAPNGATATRADIVSTGGVAPATRYKVRVTNTHPTDRLYIARDQTSAQGTTCEIVEADYGVWEDYVSASIPIWVRPIGSNSITVWIVQFAT